MRILSGRWAGRDLTSPGGRVRPTAETLRGLWLDHLAPDLDDARVLDLFAGTGALGLEAISRGARTCDFVENGRSALHALKANVARFRLKKRTRVFRHDALHFLGQLDAASYDICLADPPYSSHLDARLVELWSERPFATVLAIEHAREHRLAMPPRGARRHRIDHDASTVTFYRARR